MPEPEHITAQQERLAQHRKTVQILLSQISQHGRSYAPPVQISSLAEAREGIAHCKAVLQGWGVSVDDHPDDVGPDTSLSAAELLVSLPLDDIPLPQNLPTPHRMPLRPNPLFVGREDELRSLASLLKIGGRVATSTGFGGMGKTQLAVELVHRYGAYFAGGVFWVSCADPAGIPGEIAACGLIMGLFPPAGVDQETQVQLTRAAWQEPIPRLLIFDNCEEEQLLRAWLPTSGAARVLVTSRKQSGWRPELRVMLMPLDTLSRADSVQLLQQLAPRLSAEEATQIAEALGDLPLELHLAGRYLARYRLSAADYLARRHDASFKDAAQQVLGGEPNTEQTFALSLARLDVSKPTDDLARQFLARAACFAPGEPFRRAWLEATVTPKGDEDARLRARLDAIERLLELGLLEAVGEEEVRLHRLLAAYTERELADDAALSAVERVISDEAIRANSTGLPAAMQPVLTHLRYAVQRAQGREEAQAARLLNELGYHLRIVGSYAEALLLYELALYIRERVLGADHPQTATSLNNLVELYRAQGVYERALPLCERALDIREQVLGTDHPDTAESLNNLASLHQEQGDYERALPLFERALDIREQALGTDHPDTAESLNNLALLLKQQGAYEQALTLYERALAIYERALGADHPDTATSLNNLANLHYAQGAYERALPLLERALAIYERALGADHPDTATSLNNLANLHYAQGAYERALPLYERALALRERVLGADHPDTARSLNDLAGLYKVQGAYERAVPLYERALRIRQDRLGPQHPDTLLTQRNLAGLQRAMARAALPPKPPKDR